MARFKTALKWTGGIALAVLALAAVELKTHALATARGSIGWFRADIEAADYAGHFSPLDLTCSDLKAKVHDPAAPFIVLVHGIGGEGPEMHTAVPLLLKSPHASLFVFRWVFYEQRDDIVDQLASGLTRLMECLPQSEGRLVVLAHSAGGVLATLAANKVRLPPRTTNEPWLTVLTVASPLAGKRDHPPHADGSQEAIFFLDLGTHVTHYPAPAAGVAVVHLRTHYPADIVMMPSLGGVSPNDPTVGAPGAPQIDLPDNLGHAAAFEYAAQELAAGHSFLKP